MHDDTSSRQFFEAKYADTEDPWSFASSPYELDRYAAILESLSGRRYHRGFEPGCSVGVLTEQLAAICEHLEAIDISSIAADRAKTRCKHCDHVNIHQGALPEDIPEGTFDLIVLSEVGYYFEPKILAKLADSLVSRLAPEGVLLAAHWRGNSDDHKLTAEDVHYALHLTRGLKSTFSARHPGFLLDRWARL